MIHHSENITWWIWVRIDSVSILTSKTSKKMTTSAGTPDHKNWKTFQIRWKCSFSDIIVTLGGVWYVFYWYFIRGTLFFQIQLYFMNISNFRCCQSYRCLFLTIVGVLNSCRRLLLFEIYVKNKKWSPSTCIRRNTKLKWSIFSFYTYPTPNWFD